MLPVINLEALLLVPNFSAASLAASFNLGWFAKPK